MKDELRSLSLAILLSFIAIYSVNYFFGIDKKSAVQRQISEIEQAAEQLKQLKMLLPKISVSNLKIIPLLEASD